MFFVAANTTWAISYAIYYENRLDAVVEDLGFALHASKSTMRVEYWALIFGILMWPSLWLLFWPIPHNSFIQWITGLSYTSLIRYHRWMGHGTMVLLSLHGILYYIYWGLIGDFKANIFDWGEDSSINYLAGTISWLFALVLWVTSINVIRRGLYNLFYRAHVVCFLGFTAFAYMHYFWAWSYFLPGLLLYAVDIVMRAGQLSNVSTATAVKTSSDGTVATMELVTSPSVPIACPMAELAMMIPSISRWQWHFFSIAGVRDNPNGGQTLTFSIKQYNNFTKQLMSKLLKREVLPVRVSGPLSVGFTPAELGKFDTLVMFGGGIGTTPMLSLLRSMIHQRHSDKEKMMQEMGMEGEGGGESSKSSAAAALSGPKRVVLVCISRNASELEILDRSIMEAATSSSEQWLTVSVYLTSSSSGKCPFSSADKQGKEDREDASSENDLSKDASAATLQQDSPNSGSDLGKYSSSSKQKEGCCPMNMKGNVLRDEGYPSPFGWNLVRKVQHHYMNDFHLAIIHIAVFFACFLGTYWVVVTLERHIHSGIAVEMLISLTTRDFIGCLAWCGFSLNWL